MVKYISCWLLLLVVSCRQNTPAPKAEYDTQAFEMKHFSGRVHRFLQSQTETAASGNYFALFVNTEGCSACTAGSFSDLRPFLSRVDRPTFIYFNDSNIVRSAPENNNLQLVYLPTNALRSKKIFHNQMYLYAVRNGRIEAINITYSNTDSLNRSVR